MQGTVKARNFNFTQNFTKALLYKNNFTKWLQSLLITGIATFFYLICKLDVVGGDKHQRYQQIQNLV